MISKIIPISIKIPGTQLFNRFSLSLLSIFACQFPDKPSKTFTSLKPDFIGIIETICSD